MKLSLAGFYSSHRSTIYKAEEALRELEDDISHSKYQEIEIGLEWASSTAHALFDTIIALLREDISKEEAIEFFAINPEGLKTHRHTNELITFTPKTPQEDA